MKPLSAVPLTLPGGVRAECPAPATTEGTTTKPTLRIAIIGSSRHPISQPFAGGLESHVWHLARALSDRGHRVTLFAAAGSDVGVAVEHLLPAHVTLSDDARRDVSMPAAWVMSEHHAYLTLMLDLGGGRADEFDLVHNHSLHHLPVAMSPALRRPMVTTLHTPPTPWLESALTATAGARDGHVTVAVSADTARRWHAVTGPLAVVPNGVDLAGWPLGPGGEDLVWTGRIVPEKGLDLAIDAARAAGRRLKIAGPISDPEWFRREIEPRLGDDVEHVGHLDRGTLHQLVGHAAACLVTPRWDEPYGLVVAEALASGTPVVAFRRGGIPEIVDATCAVLVDPDDVTGLAAAVDVAVGLDRADCRRRAERVCSLDGMVDRYEAIYAEAMRRRGRQAAHPAAR